MCSIEILVNFCVTLKLKSYEKLRRDNMIMAIF